METEGQPYVLLAVLCQRAQQDQYGSLSLINVIEQLVVGSTDPNPPEQMPTFRFQGNLVVSLASGPVRRRGTVRVRPIRPSGEALEPVYQEVEFRGEDNRVTLVSNLSFDVTEPGLHWFDVLLEDAVLTRIPLRVRYERARTAPWLTRVEPGA
ncbi:MAG: hypothetical protein IRY97_05840 [Thermomicrobiaceae bacterium]|nr:hypothetical protein [Thermomicrobiaceae bacterium]